MKKYEAKMSCQSDASLSLYRIKLMIKTKLMGKHLNIHQNDWTCLKEKKSYLRKSLFEVDA